MARLIIGLVIGLVVIAIAAYILLFVVFAGIDTAKRPRK